MKLVDLKITGFVNEVDSKSPAPGGGSVAALAGSLSSALTRMVAHLTIGKKKFRALDENIQEEALKHMEVLSNQKDAFVDLVDKDTEAFNMIMAAFKLPKETDDEKAIRSSKIQEATIVAIEVPYQVASNCIQVFEALEYFKVYGNKNCLSDLGVSALLLHTTQIGAVMNMKINLSGIKDESVKAKYDNYVNELTKFSKDKILPFVDSIYCSL